MKILRPILCLFSVFLFCLPVRLPAADPGFDYDRAGAHPRILLGKKEMRQLRKTVKENPPLGAVHARILELCDGFLEKPVLERKMLGRRMLSVSRNALQRIFYLSYAYRMTGRTEYLERAAKELDAVSAFSDWNPSHFLDCAEMTMAVAIGYDWLYGDLSSRTRENVRRAIVEKGLGASLVPRYEQMFTTRKNNWNQVCHAGMVYGALAVLDTDRALAERVIVRAVENNPGVMEMYAPDGVYPEGYNYWGYGTSFEVMMLAALEHAFGSDAGLSRFAGFDRTAGYMLYMTGPSGLAFNYSDSGPGVNVHPAMFWFAQRYGNPSWVWTESRLIGSDPGRDRLLPALVVFARGLDFDRVAPPAEKVWAGGGPNPVVLVRTGWKDDPQDKYLAMKGGSAQLSHTHLDMGSFVYDAGGLRWAMDLGMVDYNSFESRGVKLWGREQNSERWTIFRYNNYAHNTLTVNGRLHDVHGFVPVTRVYREGRELGGRMDLSALFPDLKSAGRKAVIVDEKRLVVEDRVVGGERPAVLRFSMVTPAQAEIVDAETIRLTQRGQTMTMRFKGTRSLTVRTWPTKPARPYEPSNEGTVIVGFEAEIPAGAAETFEMTLEEAGK